MRNDATGIAGWVKNSFIDFPGTVSTVLFFSGCNLRCPYCHNPQLALGSLSESIALSTITAFLEKRKKFMQGVVLSGGEPTIHNTARIITQTVRSIGYKVKLDTNGLLPEKINDIAPDYLALDIKTVPSLYSTLLGAPYQDIEKRLAQSIAIAKAMHEKAEIRITIAPEIINKQIIEEIGKMIHGVLKVFLQPMRNRGSLLEPSISEKPVASQEELNLYKTILETHVGACEIR